MINVKNSEIEWGNAIYYLHKQGDFVLSHSHEFYEVVLYKNGTGRTNYNIVEYSYRDKTLLIIPPRTEHQENTLTATEVTCLQISLPDTMKFPLSIIYSSPDTEEIFERIEFLLKSLTLKWFEVHPPVNFNPQEVAFNFEKDTTSSSDKILELILQINKLAISSHQYEYSQNLIFYAKSYIEKNFNKKISFPILAEQLGYSYNRFRFLFKQKTNQTLKQYQLGVQLSNTKRYLVETKLHIKDIAKKCGFSSDIRFISDFKDKFHITPIQYRNLIKVNFGNTSGVANLNQSSNLK